MGFVVGLLVSW